MSAPTTSDEIGALSWLWNLGAFVLSAILGWFGGWMAFIGSTKARLDNLEKNSERLQESLDSMNSRLDRILERLIGDGHGRRN